MTLASGVPTWAEGGGGGDSTAAKTVANNKLITAGKAVVLNGDVEEEQLNYGLGSQSLITQMLASDLDGLGS